MVQTKSTLEVLHKIKLVKQEKIKLSCKIR